MAKYAKVIENSGGTFDKALVEVRNSLLKGTAKYLANFLPSTGHYSVPTRFRDEVIEPAIEKAARKMNVKH